MNAIGRGLASIFLVLFLCSPLLAQEQTVPPAKASRGIDIRLRAGGGMSLFSLPALEGNFAVQDDSPSHTIYGFSGDAPAKSKEVTMGAGLGLDYWLTNWMAIGFNGDFYMSPIDTGLYLFSGSGGPTFTIGQWGLDLGIGCYFGFHSYNANLEFEAGGDSGEYDTIMEFDGTVIWFDGEGKADGSLHKSSFVVVPEVFAGYQFTDNFGIRGRVQYHHDLASDEPWKITARETDKEPEATFDYDGKYVPAGTPRPEQIEFSGFVYLVQLEFLFSASK